MKIFIPNQTNSLERRVALVPAMVKRLRGPGVEVIIEAGAGAAASYPDAAYEAAGGKIVGTDGWGQADIVLAVAPPEIGVFDKMPAGSLLIGMLAPHRNLDLIHAAAVKNLALMAMEYLPRITRAQSMDVLSSQANLAGYKAVIIAAQYSPRIFPMLMTAAGTLQPAKVFVIGAGVAGLQAIATARRLGALVSAYDVRPAVKEQVQSVGAKFIELPLDTQGAQDSGGYAKQLTPEQQEKQRELMAQTIRDSDVVITTAAVPEKPAPRLIPEAVVARMQPHSVIVDLAAESGGNCELTEPGKIVEKHGVTLVGLTNLAGTVPFHASQAYASNLANLLKLIVVSEGAVNVDAQDEIIAGILLCQNGQIVHPRIKEMTSHA